MKKIIFLMFFLVSTFSFSEVLVDNFTVLKCKFNKWAADDGLVEINKEIVKEGDSSLKFEYIFKKPGATCIEWNNLNIDSEKEKGIGFWIYGNNSGNNLIFRVFTDNKNYFVSSRIPINWSGWKYLFIPKEKFSSSGDNANWGKISFIYLIIEHPSSGYEKGRIFLDKFCFTSETTEEKTETSYIPLLRDNEIEVLYDEGTGSIQVISVKENYNFLDDKYPIPVWEIEIRDADNKKVKISSNEKKPQILTDLTKCKITWNYTFENNKYIKVIVEGEISNEHKGISSWRINVENKSDGTIRFVNFPRFLIKDDTDGILAFPLGKGIYIKNPSECKGLENLVNYYGFDLGGGYYPCSIQTMQLFTYYNKNTGLYFATHDEKCNAKQFRYKAEPQKKVLEFILLTPVPNMLTKNNNYQQEYNTVIGTYKGDWYEASLIYREWALKQVWCSKGPLYKRDDIPEWFKKCSFWYSAWLQPKSAYDLPNYYPKLVQEKGKENLLKDYVSPSDRVIKFKNYFGSKDSIMGFQWYAWNIQSPWYMEFPHYGQKYDPNFPELCPHKETPEDVIKVKKENIHTIPYVNTYLWETTVPSYKEAVKFSVKKEDGEPKTGYYRKDSEGKPWINIAMCPYTEWYQNIQKTLLSQLLSQVKFDGLYLDQITAVAPQLCFDPTHGHPLGGGSWWVEGYRKLLTNLRSEVRKVNPNTILTSEANGEPYIDLLDGNLAITCTFSTEVPIYKVVYGDYSIVYGRKPSPKMVRDRTPFCAMMAQSLVNGEQLGWFSVGETVNLLLSQDYKQESDYMKKCISALEYARDFLIEGIYQKPVDINIDPPDEIPFKGSITNDEYLFQLPPILTSIYKSYNNKICFVLTNYTEKEYKVKAEIELQKYGLAKKQFKMKTWEDGKLNNKTLNNPKFILEKSIPPKYIGIYIFENI